MIVKLRQQGVEVDEDGSIVSGLLKQAHDMTEGHVNTLDELVQVTGGENLVHFAFGEDDRLVHIHGDSCSSRGVRVFDNFGYRLVVQALLFVPRSNIPPKGSRRRSFGVPVFLLVFIGREVSPRLLPLRGSSRLSRHGRLLVVHPLLV